MDLILLGFNVLPFQITFHILGNKILWLYPYIGGVLSYATDKERNDSQGNYMWSEMGKQSPSRLRCLYQFLFTNFCLNFLIFVPFFIETITWLHMTCWTKKRSMVHCDLTVNFDLLLMRWLNLFYGFYVHPDKKTVPWGLSIHKESEQIVS